MKTQLLTLDSLTVAFSITLPTITETHQFNKRDYIELNHDLFYHPIFKKIGRLYLQHEFVGWIFLEPHKNMLSNDIVHIKFSNESLYDGTYESNADYLINNLGFKLRKISSLDIALDQLGLVVYQFLEKFLLKTYKRDKRYLIQHWGCSYVSKTIVEKKRGVNNVYVKEENKNTIYVGAKFNTKGAGRFLRVYDKTYELMTHHDKAYIKKYWLKNGLSPASTIERIELSLSKSYTKDIDFWKISSVDYLASIFQLHLESCMYFYKRVRKHNKYDTEDCSPLTLTINPSSTNKLDVEEQKEKEEQVNLKDQVDQKEKDQQNEQKEQADQKEQESANEPEEQEDPSFPTNRNRRSQLKQRFFFCLDDPDNQLQKDALIDFAKRNLLGEYLMKHYPFFIQDYKEKRLCSEKDVSESRKYFEKLFKNGKFNF